MYVVIEGESKQSGVMQSGVMQGYVVTEGESTQGLCSQGYRRVMWSVRGNRGLGREQSGVMQSGVQKGYVVRGLSYVVTEQGVKKGLSEADVSEGVVVVTEAERGGLQCQ